MPELIGIARAPRILEKLEELVSANVTIESGIEGDARGKKRKRQVTILFEDDWIKACEELRSKLDWKTRRANLYVRGIKGPQKENSVIQIGKVKLKINFETDPCDIMDKQKIGLKNALTPEWRGGVCCSVVEGGKIKLCDKVYLET